MGISKVPSAQRWSRCSARKWLAGDRPIVAALIALLVSRACPDGPRKLSPAADDQPPTWNDGLGGLIDQSGKAALKISSNHGLALVPNKPVSPNQLHHALGAETVDNLVGRDGLAPRGSAFAAIARAAGGHRQAHCLRGSCPKKLIFARPRGSGHGTPIGFQLRGISPAKSGRYAPGCGLGFNALARYSPACDQIDGADHPARVKMMNHVSRAAENVDPAAWHSSVQPPRLPVNVNDAVGIARHDHCRTSERRVAAADTSPPH